MDEYLTANERDGQSPHTVASHRVQLRSFFHFLMDNKLPVEIGGIEERHVSSYLIYCRRHGTQNSSLSTMVSTLRVFFAYCQRQDFIDINPLAKIRKPKGDKKNMPIFTAEQVAAMIEAWPPYNVLGERNRTIMLLLYDTGIRASELLGLKRESVDLRQKEILITGKGRKQRIVAMSDKLRAQLYRWITQYRGDNGVYLFLSALNRPLGRTTLTNIVHDG